MFAAHCVASAALPGPRVSQHALQPLLDRFVPVLPAFPPAGGCCDYSLQHLRHLAVPVLSAFLQSQRCCVMFTQHHLHSAVSRHACWTCCITFFPLHQRECCRSPWTRLWAAPSSVSVLEQQVPLDIFALQRLPYPLQEMLSISLDEAPGSKRASLAAATQAVAFYSTPHFGSSMAALGWKLRHLPGASLAPSIHHLSPGPHLAALNARLAVLHESGAVQVLSFTEGLPTSLAGLGFIPKILIVPFESAYPGFGAVHVLGAQDHIDVCKPDSRQAPAYAELLQFVRGTMAAAGMPMAAVAAAVPEDAESSSSGGGNGIEGEGSGGAAAVDA
eukprot:GHRQ01027560.1.p1 GENE.GHRQ01027560.1~~GHRQ01027560.1.p1  ORF type:complete len:331 (-),score=56.04 GHRQ01027560.1:57-1049(-)